MVNVSVVMSVYDEPEHVQKTIDSVLKQEGIDFEFVIVSDGANDAVVAVVTSFLSDSRIRFITQENQGLTVALINGCNHARAPFIARIDAGDLMVESRLLTQYHQIKDSPNVGIVSSWVTVTTDEGYFLYDIKQHESELDKSLRATSRNQLRSVFHASVMFRRSVYEQVGGYRKQFYFSQDCDLWTRMIEQSEIVIIPQALTMGVFSASGISGRHAASQQKLSELIASANLLRQQGRSDFSITEKAKKIRPEASKKETTDDFKGLYFIAKVLSDNQSIHAREYWQEVIKLRPFNLKCWFFLLLSHRYQK